MRMINARSADGINNFPSGELAAVGGGDGDQAASDTDIVRVGVDIGGTFNDYVALMDGVIHSWKELAQEPRQRQIAESIKAHIGRSMSELVHGSTLAINALHERRYGAPSLITTAGFEDVLDLRRQRRPDLYRPWVHHVAPIIPRELRFGVTERVGPRGEIITPLKEGEAERVVRQLPSNVKAVAVSLLHAYANPAHEERVEQSLRQFRPDLTVVLSSRAFAEIGEYERASSVAVEGYLRPILDEYLTDLEASIRAFAPGSSAWIMQSVGGRLSFDIARLHPSHTVMSGPAGGVIGATIIGKRAGRKHLITFDVGGTSSDVALVRDGEPVMSYERSVAGLPLLGAGIDVHSIGAGGGSIISIDESGLLHVGPRGSGAVPGPACYGLGGEDPTLSDAHLVLGRLPADQRLAGGLKLSEGPARRSLARIARRLGREVEEVAQAAIDIVNSEMVNAIRLVSVERGYDAREHTLVAYGGAGPLHAFEVAAELGIPSVLVPYAPGVLSAFGTVAATPRADASRSILASEREVNVVKKTIRELADSLRSYLPADTLHRGALDVTLDMKYDGQNWALSVPVLGSITRDALRRSFERRYQAQYGILLDRPIEYVTVRVALVGAAEDGASLPLPGLAADYRPATRLDHRVFVSGRWRHASVSIGGIPIATVDGPAVVCLSDSTVFVPPGASLERSHAGFLLAGTQTPRR
jgi:N-methylhydantoinase A